MSLVPAVLLLAGVALAAPPPTSPLLPPDHWAVRVADRLEELGLLDLYLPAQRAVPLLVVAAALEEGERHARARSLELASAIRLWRERLAQEWSGSVGEAQADFHLLGADVGGGYEGGSTKELSNGPPATGGAAVHLQEPEPDPFATARAAIAYGSHLALSAQAKGTPWDAAIRAGELVTSWGGVQLSIGRGRIGYGPNEVGGVVMGGDAVMDRIELMTTESFRLPGFLDSLGDFAVDVALAHFNEPRHPYHPLLLDTQVQWRPHRRLTLALIRGFMFGGALWNGISFHDAALGLTGLGNYEGNNVTSASVRYRLPTDELLPLTAKVELGTDDNPGAAITWPGLVAGVTAPMLPVLSASLGVEFAFIGHFITIGAGHAPFAWYTHYQYYGGWFTGQTPLGDPLGGEGRAFRIVASADPIAERLRLSALAWVQERFAHNNYAPFAAGDSAGLSGQAELRLGRYALVGNGLYEHGTEGWKRSLVELGAKIYF
jgi:hypothetical protein